MQKTDVVLVNSDFVPLVASVKEQLTTVKKYVLLTDDPAEASGLDFEGEYEALLAKSAPSYDFPDFDENTNGLHFLYHRHDRASQGCLLQPPADSNAHFWRDHQDCAYKSHININSQDVYMPITPMFHVHAWGFPYLFTLLGAKQVYPGRYEPELLLKMILEEKVTFSHCVPTILHMMVSDPMIKQFDLSAWKVVIGGSALPKGLATAATALGIKITSGYGMSETCPLLASVLLKSHMLDWPLEDQVDMFCKTGLPAPLVQIKTIDSAGNELPRDGKSAGEIVVRAPWLTRVI